MNSTKNSLRIFLSILIFIGCCAGKAQAQFTLRGTVIAQNANAPLPQATLQLTRDTVNQMTASDENGGFTFRKLRSGNYRLVAHYLSFANDTLFIRLHLDTSVTLLLRSGDRQLTEVVIRSEVPPVTVRQDTLTFNTQAYQTRPNAPVEELLRKLPGIEIDADGNVTLNGKPVDKILIDGKAFFIDDLRKATRNLPADIVAQVETFDSSTPGRQLTGEQPNGATKTINLKLKKNKKHGIIAKVYAGGGTGGAYSAGGTMTLLSDRQFFSADVGGNNLADLFNGTENNFSLLQPGHQNRFHADLNYRNTLSKKVTVNLFFHNDYSRSVTSGTDDRATFFPDSTLLNHTSNYSDSRATNYSVGGELEYRPDAKTYIHYRLSWQPHHSNNLQTDTALLQLSRAAGDSLLSRGLTHNTDEAHGYSLNQSAGFTHQFAKKGRALSIDLNASINDQDDQRQLYSLTTTSLTDEFQNAPSLTHDYRLDSRYTEPFLAHQQLVLSYSLDDAPGHTSQTAFERDPATGLYTVLDSLNTNAYDSRITTQRIRAGISNFDQPYFHYGFGVAGQLAGQSSNKTLNDQYFELAPDLELRYKPKSSEYISFNYNGNPQNPDIRQLQPLPDLSNPYLVLVGNPALRPAFIHSASLNFFDFNENSLGSFEMGLNGSLIQHPIGLATLSLPGGVQQQQYVNLADSYNIGLQANYNWPLFGKGHGTASIGPVLNLARQETSINGISSFTRTSSAGGNFRANYQLNNRLLLQGDANLNYQASNYSVAQQPNAYGWQQNYNLEINYNLPAHFVAGGHYTLNYNELSGIPSSRSQLLNAWVGKDILADHSAQLRVSGFNLLDNANSTFVTAGQNYTDSNTQPVTRRLLLLSVVYNFKRFNNTKVN